MKNLKKAITLVLALIIALSTCMVGVSASATEDEVNTTPTEKATGDYFISDTEGADRESAENYAYGYVGDVDLTDSVNIKDATAIQKHAASLLDLRDTNAILADADLSDSINVKDATSIQKWVAGIEVNAPVYRLLTATDETIEHVHAYKFTSQPVSCDFAAHIYYKCDCGEWYRSNIVGEALGHNWGEWVVIKEADYGVDGEEKRTCSRCEGEDYREIPRIIDGDQDVIKTARDMLPLLQYTTRYFDSIEDIKEYDVREVAYTRLFWDKKYEVVGENNLFAFNRSDLENVLLIYLDTTVDWKSLNNTDVYRVEYYDETTDKVIARFGTGLGLFEDLRVSGFTDNGDGTYSIAVDYLSDGSPWQEKVIELLLKKTEYGYPAISFSAISNIGDYGMIRHLQFSVRFFDSVDEAFENEEQIRTFAYMSTNGKMDYDNLTCTYNRKDLDKVLLAAFGRTIDWTKLNNKDNDDDWKIEYYDAETDTIVEDFSFWENEGITEAWEKESVTKNDDGSYTVKILMTEGYTPEWDYNPEDSYAELIMIRSEYGYIAKSLKKIGAINTDNLLYEEDIEKIIEAYPDQCVDCRDENPSCLIVNNGTFGSVDKGKYTIYLGDNNRTSATFSKIIYNYDIMVVDDALIALFNSIRNEYGITSYYDVTGKTVDSEIVEMDDAEYLGDFKLIASLLYEYEMSWDTSNFDCDKYNGVEYECISLTGKDETGEHTLKITFYLTDGELSYDITTI